MLHAGDENHARAARAFRELLETKQDLVTTSYVLVETMALLQHRYGLATVRSFQDDVAPVLGVVWVDAELHAEGTAALLTAGRRELSCQELTGLFGLAQATVSHHLRILTEAGLVSARAEGPFHFYSAHPEALAAHSRALARAFPRAAAPRERKPSRPAERHASQRR